MSPRPRLAFFCSLLLLVLSSGVHGVQQPVVQWQPALEVDAGDGYRGPWQMNESRFHFVDDPTAAMANDGSVGVVWADQRRQDLLFQRFSGDNEARFDKPVNVSRSPDTFSWLPRMVMAPEDPDRIYVLWQEIIFSGGSHGGDILFAYSRDGGRNFSEPHNLSQTVAGAGKGRLSERRWHNGSLDLARDDDGTLYVVWTEYEGALRFTRSTDGGESFSSPLKVAGTNRHPARAPSLAVDNDTIHLAWTVGEDPAADIRLTRSSDRGESFEEETRLHPGGGHADAPRIATDGADGLHVVYSESSQGPGGRYQLRHTVVDGAGNTPDEPHVLAEELAERAGQAFAALHRNAQGRLFLVWELFPERGVRSRGLGFTWREADSDAFVPATVVPGTGKPELGWNGSQQGLLMNKLAVNDAGEVAIVNSTFKRNEHSHIWLIRGRLE